jgi:hypothetical protein
MKRAELEHIIRAAAANANVRDIVVVGSQAVLGQYPDAPAELLDSIEADVFPRDAPERSIVIDGAMGELSLFHQTFGYHAHGVDETSSVLPDGWRERLVKVENANTGGAIGWCLEPHDLAISKLVAGRDKDLSFVQTLIREKLVSLDTLRQRLSITPNIPPQVRELVEARLKHAK